jgi:hypothetical protein
MASRVLSPSALDYTAAFFKFVQLGAKQTNKESLVFPDSIRHNGYLGF